MDDSINRQMRIAKARAKLPPGIRRAIAVWDPFCTLLPGPQQGLQDPLQTENTAAPAADEPLPPPPQEQSQPQQRAHDSTPPTSQPQEQRSAKNLAQWLCSGMPGVQFPDVLPAAADSKQDKAQRKLEALERRKLRLQKRKAKLQQKKDMLEIKQIALSVARSPSHFRKIVRSCRGLLKAGDDLGLLIWNLCYARDPASIGGYRPYRPHRGHVSRPPTFKPHKPAWRRHRRRARPKPHVW